jgi:DNA modification methylase
MIDLILGDCLEKMKDIPDGSVDLILTSPPYNMNLRIRNGKYCSRQIVKELTTKYEGFDDNLTMDEYFKFNKDVIDEWQIKRGKKISNLHGAVFPLELAEFIISNFTKKGFVVLDPFMGTGTTGLACKNLERNFIGIEILETYFQIARKRIKG